MESQQLRDALALLDFPLSGDARADLERHVCDYVGILKGRDWPPERVIVAVKQIGYESGLRVSPRISHTSAWLSGHDELLVDMVRWCIEAYYRPADG